MNKSGDEMEQPASVLAPGGVLRVGLNHSNFLLVNSGSSSDAPTGIAPDLAREIARRMKLPIRFLGYQNPTSLAEAVHSAEWDIAFLAAETSREDLIRFSPAYLAIESTYMVPANSPIRELQEVDTSGVRISVVTNSAYELWLRKNLKHATLIHAKTLDESFKLFVDQKIEALAGLRPRLVLDAAKLAGSRVLNGGFTSVQQSIGVARYRTEEAAYISKFVTEVTSSGLVNELITRHKIAGVTTGDGT